ncbi:MAG: hypothetical protein WA843_05100 [Candidatus Saccharimonadales bacterium]
MASEENQHSFEITTSPEHLSRSTEHLTNTPSEQIEIANSLLVAQLGKGVLRFAEAVFAEQGNPGSMPEIYAEIHQRSAEGRGPHFDVYDSDFILDLPFVAVYNLAGRVSLKAALLPNDLHESYRTNFPELNEEAYKARREYSSIALRMPTTQIHTAILEPDMGIVIAQHRSETPIVHDVTPIDSTNPGSFIKLIAPGTSAKAHEVLGKTRYKPLDEVMTTSLALVLGNNELAPALDITPAATEQSSGAGPGCVIID